MIFIAHADGCFTWADSQVRCAVGKGGVVPATAKREGDGACPAGIWPLRHLLYRPDRLRPPVTGLPLAPLAPDDGWCDAPGDPNYNRPVKHPYPASAERMWREDGLYDLVATLGYNDAPVVDGKGSAIFLHCASPTYGPTLGCVALATADLLDVLAAAKPGDALEIRID